MSLGFTNQVYTVAQMREAMIDAFYIGWDRGKRGDSGELEMEDIAFIICEAAPSLNLIEVISALQRLDEWEQSQRDRP